MGILTPLRHLILIWDIQRSGLPYSQIGISYRTYKIKDCSLPMLIVLAFPRINIVAKTKIKY
jgi:hypothetical protein